MSITGQHFDRRLTVAVGVAALIAVGALSAACGSGGNQTPSTTTTTTTTTTTATTMPATTTAPEATEPPASPTEKEVNPTGGNLFTPGVVAPAAPTVPPGQHKGINGVP